MGLRERFKKSQFLHMIEAMSMSLAKTDEAIEHHGEVAGVKDAMDELRARLRGSNFDTYDDRLDQEIRYRPSLLSRAFCSPRTIEHREIKRLILFLNDCRQKYLEKDTTSDEREVLVQVVHHVDAILKTYLDLVMQAIEQLNLSRRTT